MKNVIIKTRGLCKSFLNDGEVNNVIKNLSVDIYNEDFTVIMGSSGSGKSTLLYLLSGMDTETSGEVFVGDMLLSKMNEKNISKFRREEIGFVFQGINLVPELTISENIQSAAYGFKKNKKKIQSEINELLFKMQIQEQKNKFPNQLSGGQCQRAAIARALINKPKVLFADEPTGALNSSQGQNVLDIFTDINEDGQAIVMVTHDLKAALRGNRIIYIKDGRIDGDLKLGKFNKMNIEERENKVIKFLQERGW